MRRWSVRAALLGAVSLIVNSAFISTSLRAQTNPAPRGILSGEVDDANDTRWRPARCLLGISYGSPLRFYVAAAAGLRRAYEARSVCAYGAAHVGLGGARGSLGTAVTLGRYGSALGVSGGLLRTFGNPGGDADPRRSYVGGSVHVWPALAVHTEFGAYTRMSRAGEASQRILVWSVGFGY